MNHDDIEQFVDTANKLMENNEKLRTLSHQYGVASRRVYELKGANALLRETIAALVDELESLEARLAEYESQPQPLVFPTQLTDEETEVLTKSFEHPASEIEKPLKPETGAAHSDNIFNYRPDVSPSDRHHIHNYQQIDSYEEYRTDINPQ